MPSLFLAKIRRIERDIAVIGLKDGGATVPLMKEYSLEAFYALRVDDLSAGRVKPCEL